MNVSFDLAPLVVESQLLSDNKSIKPVSILRQSRRLYGCWPLKGAFSQPLKSKSNRNSKSGVLQALDEARNATAGDMLPEFSKSDRLPGRAGGSPDWTRTTQYEMEGNIDDR